MMIKPSIEELTNANSCNRYTLVIASAKSARYVTAKQKIRRDKEKEREKTEAMSELYTNKSEKQPLPAEYFDVKPVSAGIQLIHDTTFNIVDPEVGTVKEDSSDIK